MTFQDIFSTNLKQANITLSDTQINQFIKYYELLTETNKVMNLTALTEPNDVAVKHFIDSLLAYDPAMHNATVADVGTGAGFPGVPLKIFDPDIKLFLIDSLAKRLKFLDTLVVELGLQNVTTVHARAEDAGKDKNLREQFDFVTARAVARLNVLVEFCLPLVKVGGKFVAMKGDAQDEIAEAENAIKLLGGKIAEIKNIKLPNLEDKRTLVIIEKIKTTPNKYPRKAGTATKEPL
ncbi:MAG: 16S rRNA (guanine(527)-N(7))-methyltransferase RsmG [Acidaminococcaceae bacterium]|nr:16S rRNA (guanine(527)-N(7))-methyltransferase RsmG [Acidaminococcaceae bacterium]